MVWRGRGKGTFDVQAPELMQEQRLEGGAPTGVLVYVIPWTVGVNACYDTCLSWRIRHLS